MLADECGVLVPPRDASALSEALRTVCSDSEFRNRIGARAREKAHQEYDIGRVVEQLVSLWRDLAGANNTAK
jgi:glycosyltransferase involved in cell wall biosynthesis